MIARAKLPQDKRLDLVHDSHVSRDDKSPVTTERQTDAARHGCQSSRFEARTEADHHQIRRAIDVYVRPARRGPGRTRHRIDHIVAETKQPAGVSVTLRGMVEGMRTSFRSFAVGLLLAGCCFI